MFRLSRLSTLTAIVGVSLCLSSVALQASSFAADTPVSAETARRFMQGGHWESANFEWRRILENDPQNVEAIVGLSESLMKTGYQQDAIELLESVPENKRVLLTDLSLARAYALVNEFSKSKQLYLKILLKIPFQMDAFREVNALRNRFSGEELKSLERDLGVVANAAKAKGEQAVLAKNYRVAANFYEIASSYLNTIGLINDYGILLLLQRQYVKAHDQFVLLKTKDKLSFSEVRSNAAMASLSIGKIAEAKAEIQDAINACQDNKLKAKLYNNMGYIYEMSSRRTDAKFAYQHALSLDPSLTLAQLNLAYVQQADREFEEAIQNYRKILTREPQRGDVWGRIGFVYELQYKSKPALAAYKKAVLVDPKNREAYYNLATIYKKMGNVKESNATLKKLAEMGYQEIEEKGSKKTQTEESNKLLKFVTLFPSDPKLFAGLQQP